MNFSINKILFNHSNLFLVYVISLVACLSPAVTQGNLFKIVALRFLTLKSFVVLRLRGGKRNGLFHLFNVTSAFSLSSKLQICYCRFISAILFNSLLSCRVTSLISAFPYLNTLLAARKSVSFSCNYFVNRFLTTNKYFLKTI